MLEKKLALPIVLRPTSKSDLEDLSKIIFDPRVHFMLMVKPGAYLGEILSCVDASNCDKDARGFTLSATLLPECRVVAGALLEQDFISYFVHPGFWRRGIGTRFVAMLVSELHRRRGLTEVKASVLRQNVASQRILERVGFKFAGLSQRQDGMTRHAVLNYKRSLRWPATGLGIGHE
jgi:RimJ/RimL family protein N-acetyltransferase